MRIGIDVRPMESHSKNRGIGYYTANLVNSLIENYSEDEFILYSRFTSELSKKINKKNVIFHKVPIVTRPIRAVRKVDPLIWTFWKYALIKTKPQIVHITSLFEVYYLNVPKNLKTVVTIYDLIPMLFKKKFFANQKAINWYEMRLNQAKNASRIITISESSKKDIVKILKIKPEKIHVVYGGINERFKVLNKDSVKQTLSKKYKIDEPFILAIGSTTINKNTPRLFQAFQNFTKINKTHKLVLVCKLEPQEKKAWEKIVRELGIEERVIITNFIADKDLPLFYNGAEVLVLPSFYEGLGLPVLEAFACGTPVITSNTSSLPEIGGEAPVYVDPLNIVNISSGIKKVIGNKKLQKEMIKKGFKQVKKFNWKNSAAQVVKIYEEVLAER